MAVEASAGMRFVERTPRLPAVVFGVAMALAGCNGAAGLRSDSTMPHPRACTEAEPCGGSGNALPASLIGLAVLIGITVAHQVWPRS